MYKYTIEAFDKSDMGKLNVIRIVVEATTDEEAIERASAIKQRTEYAIVSIEETSREFKKG